MDHWLYHEVQPSVEEGELHDASFPSKVWIDDMFLHVTNVVTKPYMYFRKVPKMVRKTTQGHCNITFRMEIK